MEENGQDHDQVEDDVLRQKEFRRGGGIDLGQFMIQEPENESIVEEAVPEKETDEAVGEIASLFSSEDEQTNEPGAIKRDGTVDEAAAPDSVTVWLFMVSEGSGTVFLPAWSLFGPFWDGLLEPHYLRFLEGHCSSSWVFPDYGLEKNGFQIQRCTCSV